MSPAAKIKREQEPLNTNIVPHTQPLSLKIADVMAICVRPWDRKLLWIHLFHTERGLCVKQGCVKVTYNCTVTALNRFCNQLRVNVQFSYSSRECDKQGFTLIHSSCYSVSVTILCSHSGSWICETRQVLLVDAKSKSHQSDLQFQQK